MINTDVIRYTPEEAVEACDSGGGWIEEYLKRRPRGPRDERRMAIMKDILSTARERFIAEMRGEEHYEVTR